MASSSSTASSSSSSSSSAPTSDFIATNIKQGSRGVGTFKIEARGVGWKPKSDGGDPVGYPAGDIQGGIWRQIGPENFEMTLLLKGGSRAKFSQFKHHAFGSLSAHLESFGGALEESPVATSGHNWGDVVLKGNTMLMQSGGRMAFEVPLADVAHSTSTRNELTIKFNEYSTVDKKGLDMLTEMRFFVSPDNRALKKLRVKEEGDVEGDDEESSGPSAAQFLKNLIDKGSNQVGEVKQAFITIPNIRFVAPRCRFELEFFESHFTIKHPSSLSKIPYPSVTRMHFLKYKRDCTLFIFSLSPPMRRGATPYSQIIAEFRDSDEELEDLEVAMSEKARGSLPAALTGNVGKQLKMVFEHFTGKSAVLVGQYKNSVDGMPFVVCSVKANDGVLYFLDSGLFFVIKPATYIRFEEIKKVEFTRQDKAGTMNFDLKITLYKDGIQYEFNHFVKREYNNIYTAFAEHPHIEIKGVLVNAEASSSAFADDDPGDDDSEDDEEFVPGQEEDEDDDYVESAGSGDDDGGEEKKDDDDGDDDDKQSSKRSRKN